LACGGGEYCLGLSEMFPQKNFIGIDIKGARIWKGAKKAFLEKNFRIAFVRTKIELIPYFFGQNEISEIWITFPDPFLKNSKSNKRLTSPHYLDIYKKILADSAVLHLKTDDDSLYNFSLEVIRKDPEFSILDFSNDIYGLQAIYPELEWKTYYEMKHLAIGKKIKYIRFQFNKKSENLENH
jgi:tRNA (guanine-N7-)-methyltransferase